MPRITGVIPEHIRKLMPAETRRAMGKAAFTMADISAEQSRKLERKLQEEIAGYLRLKEIVFFQQRMDKRTTGTVGWPDFTFVIAGRACFLEVKRPGESPTAEQWRILNALIDAGACVSVVTSLEAAIRSIAGWHLG